ncbi:MAG: type II secretion system F family protein [Lachnospiraceae bacterium]|nr:type II secretion system F family protein [Lachnospiraceae bacterium]
MKKTKQKLLSKQEIASFCDQMAMIIKAGITPKDGLELMLSDTKDAATKEVLEELLKYSRLGENFSTCVKSSGYFPSYVINMIALGEETGQLDDVLVALCHYYEHEEYISDNIRSAVTYPVVMIVMMLLIIIILVTKVLPLFNQVFAQLGTQMSGFAASLLSLGQDIQTYSFAFVIVVVALMVLFFVISKTDDGKRLRNKFLTAFPPTRAFQRDIAYGRFARGMSLTLASGMKIYTALDLTDELVEHKEVRQQIEELKQHIVDGSNFSEALNKAGIFNHLYSRMIFVGVKSGNVDIVLDKIATYYEEDTDRRLNNFISIIEPTLVISLSLIVGLILLSVILPLMGIMSGLG